MSASSLTLPQGKRATPKQFISRHINEIGLLVVITILYLIFSFNAPGFISLRNERAARCRNDRDCRMGDDADYYFRRDRCQRRTYGGVYLRLSGLPAAVSSTA